MCYSTFYNVYALKLMQLMIYLLQEKVRDHCNAFSMAAGLVGMAFIPYYTHLMDILDTDEELRKTARGK